jgi:hypothetical protein
LDAATSKGARSGKYETREEAEVEARAWAEDEEKEYHK